jgi:hypothetical protein
MGARRALVIFGLCALVPTGCGGIGQPRVTTPPTLRIEKLTGIVANLGSFNGYPLFGVRLRATVCTSSNAEIYPDFTIAHYLLAGYPARKWMLVRKVFDRPPYLVPLQETWHGRHCGLAEVDDPIPPDHTGGVEQLGNPWSCYGVALTIWAGKTHATRRAAIQCGGIGGLVTCAPAHLITPPWVVGERKQPAVKRLHAAGFHVSVDRAEKPKRGVSAGIVIDQEPERGFRICRRADISLVVSV